MNKQRENSGLSRLMYGMADIYGGGAFIVISTFFTVFLTKALGMPTALAGTIPLIGKVWDAITDPLMGNICDRTQSKFGAKRFYILLGSIVSAITFLLMWVGFETNSTMGQYFFYMCMYILFSTGFTIVMVPYNALLPDMVEDYKVRARYSGTRMICSTFGAILAGLIPSIIISDNTNAASYFAVAIIFAIIFFVAIFMTFLGTWERSKEPVKVGFVESFTQSLTIYKCKSYRLFIGIFLFGQAAADFLTGLAVYYIDDVLNSYGGGHFTMLMGVILLSQFLGTIIFSVVMPVTSKKFPILFGTPVRMVATLAMLFFSYEGANFAIILCLTFFIGLGMAGTSTSIYAILADMADVDELITSVNRPAVCSAMATFVRKIAAGLSSAVIGVMLGWVGYNETLAAAGERQSQATQSGIAAIYIWAPMVLMAFAFLFAILFPMNQKQFVVIKKEVARRKGEDSSKATAEEIAICEKVTGFSYDKLWNKDNAFKMKAK